jgi:O-antigen ligase
LHQRLAALRLPEDATLLFWLFALHLLTVWGLALSNAFLGAMIVGAIYFRKQLDWRWPATAPILVPLGCFSILYVVAIVFSLEPKTSGGELADLTSFATVLLAPVLAYGERAVRFICNGLVAVISIFAVHGIWQYLFTDYGSLHRRIVGIFSHYQTFAGVLLIGLLAVAAQLACGRGWRSPWRWTAFGLIFAALLLTLTRGAWVAAAITLGALALVRARRFLTFYVVAAVALGLFLVFLAPVSWLERAESISNLQDVSNYDRVCMAEAATFMIAERPLLGVGPEAVKVLYPIYRNPTAPRLNVPHLHNAILMRAAEQGLPSLLVYGWLMFAGIRLAWRSYREGRASDLSLAALLVLIGFNIASLFEDNWRDTEVRRLLLFFLVLPLCLEKPQLEKPQLERPRPDTSSCDNETPSP